VLDAYIIDEIKKREDARRREEQRPRLQIEIDPRRREPPKDEERPEERPEERDEEEREDEDSGPVRIRM
jgi:hypothetical protein